MSDIHVDVSPVVTAELATHENYMGHTSYDLSSPITKLQIMAASCFFGEPSYYIGGVTKKVRKVNYTNDSVLQYLFEVLKGVTVIEPSTADTSPAKALEAAIDAAIEHDLEATLRVAASLRQDDNIRTTPQVILVRAANHASSKGTGLIRRYAPFIIKRADEPAVQLAYQLNVYKKPIPTRLKKAWSDYLRGCSEYQLAKYRMVGRKANTMDVVRLSHANSVAIDKLSRGELTLDAGQTWESLISTKGSTTETWTEAVEVMGHMALLRNLRNLNDKGVAPILYIDKLINGVADGKQLPFRYYSAWQAVEKGGAPNVLAALETCMDRAVEAMPKFPGRVMSLCDNSGSAHGTLSSVYGTVKVSTIANMTGVITGMLADDGRVGVFGDRLETVVIDPSGGVLAQTEAVEKIASGIGMGTETGIWLFWQKALADKEHWDHVFIYSDMQAGHGELFINGKLPKAYVWKTGGRGRGNTHVDLPALVAEYRKTVNPDVRVYCVQVAGYGDTIIPEVYDKTYILGGWSDGIFKFAHRMAKIGV